MRTRRFAVIGDPIEHSLSPQMHNAALAAAGIPGRYEAIHVSPSDLGQVVDRLRKEAYCGFNVTIPHKEAVRAYLDSISTSARAVAAVNTVLLRDGKLHGDNTDVPGFCATLDSLGQDFRDAEAIVFGSGGAARAVVYALLQMGARVAVASRTAARAEELARRFDHLGPVSALPSGKVEAAAARADLLVNATPLGMSHLPDLSPLPPDAALRPEAVAVDLIYGPTTPFLQEAAARGCRTMDGLEMLVQQGRASFRLWTGIEPDAGVMREACLASTTPVARPSVADTVPVARPSVADTIPVARPSVADTIPVARPSVAD